jgi:hypothetical protein
MRPHPFGRVGPPQVSSKRELIDTGRNKMFAKRDVQGRFKEMDDVSRSPSGGPPQDGQDRLESWARRPGRSSASGDDEEEVATRRMPETTGTSLCQSCSIPA